MKFLYSLDWVRPIILSDQQALLLLLKEHDPKTYEYSLYVGMLNDALGAAMGMNDEERYAAFWSGVMHDIGKLGMSLSFLHFPGAYTPDMFAEMQKHVEGGCDLLFRAQADSFLYETVRNHHINYDGSGYPGGPARKGIPLHARMTRITDSAEAFLTNRSYKAGGAVRDLRKDLEQYQDSWYDPYILSYFLSLHERLLFEAERRGIEQLDKETYIRLLFDCYAKVSFERFLKDML